MSNSFSVFVSSNTIIVGSIRMCTITTNVLLIQLWVRLTRFLRSLNKCTYVMAWNYCGKLQTSQ